MGAALGLLGGHVAGRPHDQAVKGLAGIGVQLPRQAEVGHLRLALAHRRVDLAGQEHVPGLEVAVDEVAAVGQVHCLGQRRHQAGRVARGQRPPRQPLVQRAARNVFQCEKRPSVRFANFVNLNDIRVL